MHCEIFQKNLGVSHDIFILVETLEKSTHFMLTHELVLVCLAGRELHIL